MELGSDSEFVDVEGDEHFIPRKQNRKRKLSQVFNNLMNPSSTNKGGGRNSSLNMRISVNGKLFPHIVKRGSLGRGLISSPGVYSSAISLGKGLTVH